MIVDTSAIVAILKAEPDAQVFAEALASHPGAAMSAATFVETAAVIDNDQDPMLGRLLDALLSEAEIDLAAFTPEQARIARLAKEEELAKIRPELDGNEIQAVLGIKPGPLVGKAYKFLLDIRLDRGLIGKEAATKELLRWAREQGLEPPAS